MRHRVVGRKLNRTPSHRRALLRSLSTELIRHKKITTTEAKAKEASKFVDRLITRAKRARAAEGNGGAVDAHAKRMIGRDIRDKSVLRELFGEVAEKLSDRSGGYTRIVRIGRRNGDGAEMAVLELVDYNLDRDESAVRSKTKQTMSRAERVRRSQEKQKKKEAETKAAEVADAETAESAETAEAAAEETPEGGDAETRAEAEAKSSESQSEETASADEEAGADEAKAEGADVEAKAESEEESAESSGDDASDADENESGDDESDSEGSEKK